MAELLYGFYNLKDVLGQPVTDGLIPKINEGITATLREYNRQMAALSGLFVQRLTDHKLRYKSPSVRSLQPLDENGRARPVKVAGYYDIAFPLQAAGDAWGANFVTTQKLKVADLNDWLALSLTADRKWMADHIVAALTAATSWTFPDEAYGDLTVMPLANGDDQPYLIRSGSAASTTDNHLLAQAADISDAANPFPAVHRELTEHPENGGERATVLCLVASDLIDDIEGLAGFKERFDPDITPGSGTDVLSGQLAAAVPGVVRGKVNNCWVVEWGSLPSGYLLGTTLEADKPLAQREHPELSLQGFIELPSRSDTPYLERQFQRHAGFGAYNRVGALALRVGNASYATPSGYVSPLG